MSEKILVTRSSIPTLEEYVDEIREIFDSHWLTNMGPKHKALASALKDYLGSANIELFTNGHMSLELTLQAMDFEEGSEVITTPFTFASTTHSIVRNRLHPVLCDIREDNYTIDETKIEELITNRTVAIMPVHVYGNICNVFEIESIARKHGLKVIYDAAHSFGCLYKGIPVGQFGDVSCFSFHATKVFNSIEGGAACFSNEEFGKKLYHLKNFGIDGAESVSAIGANAKMNEFCAAMGLCNLRHIDEEMQKRKAVFEAYIDGLRDIPGLTLPIIQDDVRPNYAYFPVLFDKDICGATRDDVFAALTSQNYFPRKYFYPIVSEYDCYKKTLGKMKTPVAEKISRQVLTLPFFADLSLDDVRAICAIITAALSPHISRQPSPTA